MYHFITLSELFLLHFLYFNSHLTEGSLFKMELKANFSFLTYHGKL